MPCFIDLAPHHQTCREKGPISFTWGTLVSCGRARLLPSQMTFRKVYSWNFFLKNHCVCVCVYVYCSYFCVYTFCVIFEGAWAHIHEQVLIWRAEPETRCFFLCLLPQDRIFHWTGCLPFWLAWMTKEVGISQSLTHNSRIRDTCSHTWFCF